MVAEVDFGHVGKLRDPRTGERRDAWGFVMVLGHSRRLVARLVFDQRAETWVRLHIEAFAELGGVPATIAPDNLKASGDAMAKLRQWLEDQRPHHLPRGPLGRVIGYGLNQWPALMRLVTDVRLPPDNNAAERSLRVLIRAA